MHVISFGFIAMMLQMPIGQPDFAHISRIYAIPKSDQQYYVVSSSSKAATTINQPFEQGQILALLSKEEDERVKKLEDQSTNLQKKLEDQSTNLQKMSEDLRKDATTTMKDYNNNLLNTVFFSLLGTVATIAIAFFGLKFFAEELQRENEKARISGEMKDLVEDQLPELINSKLFDLKRRINWLEYQISILSAEVLEHRTKSSHLSKILSLQERIRSLNAAYMLVHYEQPEIARNCINQILVSIEDCLDILDIEGNSSQVKHNNGLSKIESEQVKFLESSFKEICEKIQSSNDSEIANCTQKISTKMDKFTTNLIH